MKELGGGEKPRAHSFWSGQMLSFEYIKAEIRREKRSFVIGLFTVFLVVFFTAVLQNAVLKSPIIFFRISEQSAGEMDLIMTPGLGVNDANVRNFDLPLLNHTYIDGELVDEPLAVGAAPRWVLVAKVLLPPDQQQQQQQRPALAEASALVLGMDSVREEEIGLGRNWPFGPLGQSECYLSRSVVRQLGLDVVNSVGSDVTMRIDLLDLARTLKLLGGIDDDSTEEEQFRALLERLVPGIENQWNQTISAVVNTNNFTIEDLGLNANDLFGTAIRNIDLSLLNITIDTAQLNFTTADFNLTRLQDLLDNVNVTAQGVDLTAFLREAANEGALDSTLDQLNGVLNDTFPFSVNVRDALFGTNGVEDELARIRNGTVVVDFNQFVNDFIRSLPGFNTSTVLDLFPVILPALRTASRIESRFTIRGVVDTPDGKWPEVLGSVLALESTELFRLLKDGARQLLDFNITNVTVGPFDLPNGSGTIGPIQLAGANLDALTPLRLSGATEQQLQDARDQLDSLDQAITDLDQNSAALLSVAMYRDRLDAYMKDLEALNQDMIKFTNAVSKSIGVEYPATFNIPLTLALQGTIFIRYFLDNIFGAVIALIVALGILLIYSLLLNDVESKTYEYGMLRALGMRQYTLIQILMTKSLLFSMLGIGTGLLFAYIANVPIAQNIADFAHIPPDYTFFPAAIVTAVVIGFVMPVVANVVPISRALGRTLRDSLDVYHHVISDVTVRVIKLQNLGLELWQTALAILMIVVGFCTFYLIPYAFTFNNIPLFLGVLTGILLGMLTGLCLISSLVQPYLERVVLRVMLACHHQHLRAIVRKNLSGHRTRNRKTALMFTICLAFIVFAGVMFSLQSRSIGDNLKVFFGSDIRIEAPNFDDRLRETEMRQFLDGEMSRRAGGATDSVVVDYAFVTYDLKSLSGVDRVRFSNLPQFPEISNFVYGVPANYLNVVYDKFWVPESAGGSAGPAPYPRTSRGDPDSIRLMYTDANNARLPAEANGIHIPRTLATGLVSSRVGDFWQTDPRYNGTDPNEARQAELRAAYTEYVDVIASEALREFASISLKTPLHLSVRSRALDGGRRTKSYLCKARALVSKVPGFFFSSYRQTAGFAPLLMRDDSFERLMREAYTEAKRLDELSVTGTPKKTLQVRTAASATREQREDVINGLRTFFRSDATLVIDVLGAVETTNQVVDLLTLFFTLVGGIAMIMCFFILWLSFTANVQENSWEFGVLRAVGINGRQVLMLYVYEALSLVLASVILGTAVGLAIAVSLTLQFNLFLENRFEMEFPYTLFFSMFTLAIVVSVIGSAWPARKFLGRSISEVIRRI